MMLLSYLDSNETVKVSLSSILISGASLEIAFISLCESISSVTTT